MPELPDVEVCREALAARAVGAPGVRVTLRNPFVLRTVVPPVSALDGRAVREVRRLGRRIVFAFDDAYCLVVHLTIAGRAQRLPDGGKAPAQITLALAGKLDGCCPARDLPRGGARRPGRSRSAVAAGRQSRRN